MYKNYTAFGSNFYRIYFIIDEKIVNMIFSIRNILIVYIFPTRININLTYIYLLSDNINIFS